MRFARSARAPVVPRRAVLAGLACLLGGCAGNPQGRARAARPARGDLLRTVLERGTLAVATDGDYMPQSYRNADGSWTGFDIDVAAALARGLGVAARFHDVSFDLITAGHWSGRFDVHVGSMTVTREREMNLHFTPPYYYLPATFAVHAGSRLARIADLAGKKIGVARATTYEAYFGGTLDLVGERVAIAPPRADPISYETDAEAIDDLALGDGLRLDAVLGALPTLRSAIAAGKALRTIDRAPFAEDCAVVLDRFAPERNDSLARRLDEEVAKLHHDGTLSRLSRHYYGVDLSIRS